MNLASFYLCLFMNIYNTSEKLLTALKCDIVGKEDNSKYQSHCTRITLGNDLLFFFFFFFLSSKSVLEQFSTRSSSFHSYSTTSCEYDNVEVKEKSVTCHAMLLKLQLAKMSVYFYFIFSHCYLFLVEFSICS